MRARATRRQRQSEVDEIVKEKLDEIDAPGDKPVQRTHREVEIETKRRRYAADPDVRSGGPQHLLGLTVGSVFEILSGGPELEGEWQVVQLNLGFPRPEQRNLFAGRRRASGPPYIKMSEADLVADVQDGVIRLPG